MSRHGSEDPREPENPTLISARLDPEEPPAMSTRSVPTLHFRGNGIGHLEMATVLVFFHFQQIGWK